MLDTNQVSAQLQATVVESLNTLIERIPSIAGAILILVLGWLIARLGRSLTIKLLTVFNRFMERILSGRTRTVVHFSSGVTQLVAEVLFWIILFVFTTAALQTAGLSAIASWLERIVDFLPAIVTGSLIMLIGYVLASLVKGVTYVAAHSANLAEAELLSRLAQAITLVTAAVVGLDQVGVDVTFITTILGVSTAALLAGFALAFGMGARTMVSNLIAAHYLRELVEPGQKIRIGDYEGTVLELSPTTVIIESTHGRTSIPAKLYHEQAVVVLLEDSSNG